MTWQRTELAFGLSKPDGTRIQPKQFDAFVKREIIPRFTSGFTVYSAQGVWSGGREASRTLLLLHPRTSLASRAINAIREAYKRAFSQEAVLRIDSPAQVSF